jgi:anti-anti-sigma regulatory factor
MGQPCRITRQQGPSERSITLSLQGKVDEAAMAELDRCLHEARSARMRIYVDLSEVTLMDREAARHMGSYLPDVIYVNCPAYLCPWIGEQTHGT